MIRQAQGNRRRFASRPQATTLGFQSLEPRLALAGDVMLSLDADGLLRIVGDNAANAIEVGQTAGEVWVRGVATDSGPTTIRADWNNARANLVMGIGGVRAISIDMEGGDDRVFIGGTSPRSTVFVDGRWQREPPSVTLETLTIHSGTGNNMIHVGTSEILSALTITTGKGHDVVTVKDTFVGNRIRIDAGDGTNIVGLGTVHTLREGSIGITTGAGCDCVGMTFFYTGSLSISTGGGADLINVGARFAVRPARLDPRTASKVAGNLVVNAGGGAFNEVNITQVLGGGGFIILSGAGNDRVSIDQVTVGRQVSVATGTGRDTVIVRQAEVAGNVTVATATTHDAAVAVLLDRVVSGGQLTVTTGRGPDFVSLSNVSATTVWVRTGDGNDTVRLMSVTADNVFADLGAGDDFLAALQVTALRQMLLDGGAGANVLQFDVPVPGRFFRNFARVL